MVKTVVRTALCISVPLDADGVGFVQRTRAAHDPAFERWPPHLNLIYPFADESDWATVLPALRTACRSVSPFTVNLATLDTFPRPKAGVVFAAPDADSAHRLAGLHQILTDAIGIGASKRPFHAHCTVARCDGTDAIAEMRAELGADFVPVAFPVHFVSLLARRESEPFVERARVWLGPNSNGIEGWVGRVHSGVQGLLDAKFEGRDYVAAETVGAAATDTPTTPTTSTVPFFGDDNAAVETSVRLRPLGDGIVDVRVQLGAGVALRALRAANVPVPDFAANDFVGAAGKVLLVLVADRSGSMSGRPFEQLRDALHHVNAEVADKQAVLDTRLVMYCSQAAVADVPFGAGPEADDLIDRLRIGGATSFAAAFNCMKGLITELTTREPMRAVHICFLTDGQDTSSGGKAIVTRALETTRADLRALGVPVAVHSIGFGRDHDFAFLSERVRCMGTVEGGYRYCETSDAADALRQKVSDVLDFVLAECDGAGTVLGNIDLVLPADNANADTNADALPAAVDVDVVTGVATGTIELCNTALQRVRADGLDVRVGGGSDNGGAAGVVERVRNVVVDTDTPVDASGARARTTLWRLSRRVAAVQKHLATVEHAATKSTKSTSAPGTIGTDLQELSEELMAVQRDVTERRRIYPRELSRVDRQAVLAGLERAQQDLDAVHTDVSMLLQRALEGGNGGSGGGGGGGGGASSVAEQARRADLRFGGKFQKARRTRKMQQMAMRSAGRAQAESQALEALFDEMQSRATSDDDGKSNEESTELFRCLMSLSTWDDLRTDRDALGDVLGVGVRVARSELVVDAVHMLNVQELATTVLSRDAFADAQRFNIDLDAVDVHGGFEGHAGSRAVQGRTREPLNALLPLFVNADHWQRVRLVLPAALAQLVVCDAAAQDVRAHVDVYAVVVASLMSPSAMHNVNERWLRLVVQTMRTATAVADSVANTGHRLRDTVAAFCTDPARRLPEHVPSLRVLAAWVCCCGFAVLSSDERRRFWQAVRWEAVRRAMRHRLADVTPAQRAGLVLALAGLPVTVEGLGNGLGDFSWTAETDQGTGGDIPGGDGEDDGDDGDDDGVASVVSMGPKAAVALRGRLNLVKGRGSGAKVDAATRAVAEWAGAFSAAPPAPGQDSKEEEEEAGEASDTGLAVDAAVPCLDDIAACTNAFDAAVPARAQRVLALVFDAAAGDLAVLQRLEMLADEVDRWHRASAGGDAWAELDAAGGVAPEGWCDGLRRVLSAPSIVVPVNTGDGGTETQLMVRAAAAQCVELSRHAACRHACEAGRFVDYAAAAAGGAAGGAADANDVAMPLARWCGWRRERLAQAERQLVRTRRVQRAHAQMCALFGRDALWQFAGVLAVLHNNDRGSQLFGDLLRKLGDPDRTVADRLAKIRLVLTGKLDDEPVFANGNAWRPRGRVRAYLVGAVGEGAYTTIEAQLGTVSVMRGWTYRSTGLRNRHGHSNEFPLWDEKRGGVVRYKRVAVGDWEVVGIDEFGDGAGGG